MYKGLIIAVTLLLIGGAGYYFREQGLPSLVAQNFSQGGNGKNYGVSAIQVFSGLYECSENGGCKNVTQLVLEDDTTLDINAIIDGQMVGLGQGTWGIGHDGSLVLMLHQTDPVAGGVPRSLIAKKISTLRLSGFSNSKALFDGMSNPTFIRIPKREPLPVGAIEQVNAQSAPAEEAAP